MFHLDKALMKINCSDYDNMQSQLSLLCHRFEPALHLMWHFISSPEPLGSQGELIGWP